jgi:hypothetical protein
MASPRRSVGPTARALAPFRPNRNAYINDLTEARVFAIVTDKAPRHAATRTLGNGCRPRRHAASTSLNGPPTIRWSLSVNSTEKAKLVALAWGCSNTRLVSSRK